MVIKAAKVPDSAFYRETPAWTLTISMPALLVGWALLQKLGSYLEDTVTAPLPRPVNCYPVTCVTSPGSFPYIFNPFFGHNVCRWNIYPSLSPPIRKLGWFFLCFLLYFCLPLGHAAGKALWQVHGSPWTGLWVTSPWRPFMPGLTSLSHDTQCNPSWRPLSFPSWSCWLTHLHW